MTDRVGLANIGNTCFLNVVLQALRMSPPLVEYFLTHPTLAMREESPKKEMVTAFQTLLRDMWTVKAPADVRPSLVPRGFFHSLYNVLRTTDSDWYRPGQQCDAAEALQYILDCLHDGLYKRVRMDVSGSASTHEESSQVKAIESWATFFSREYSPIVNMFNGQFQIKTRCESCGNCSERYEPWLMLKAAIPGGARDRAAAPTLEECLKHEFSPEMLDDYHCEKCNTRGKAIKQQKLSRMPPVCIVTIKRFTNTGHKVSGLIPWDVNGLDFSPWMAFHRDPFTNSTEAPVYETFAVIEHHGFAGGGHYRMYAREGPKWLQYDDSSVSEARPEIIVTPDSYIALLVPKASSAAMYAKSRAAIEAARAETRPELAREA